MVLLTKLGFVDQYVLKMFMIFLLQYSRLVYVLNHFHLSLCKDQESSTLPCLHPNVDRIVSASCA